ncbi:hypothetical protein GQ42DRAFT_113102, partial [Ramicandelaber brevisporus]
YEVHYLDVVGLGEPCRAILSYGGADWRPVDIPAAEFASGGFKDQMPYGVVPVLREFDPATGDLVFEAGESTVIERYLAAKFGLMGDSEREAALIHAVRIHHGAMVSDHLNNVFFNRHKPGHDERVAKCRDAAAYLIKYHTRMLERNGGNGFYVGSKLSLADIALFMVVEIADEFGLPELFAPESAPLLHKVVASVKSEPRLQAYL